MKYKFIEQPAEKRGHNWFGHHVTFYLSNGREGALMEHLKSYGKRGQDWRFSMVRASYLYLTKSDQTIRFARKSNAIKFKLSWEEEEYQDPLAWMKKMSLNSSFGGLGGWFKSTAPTWTMPVPSAVTSGIYPTRYSGKSIGDLVMIDYDSNILRHNSLIHTTEVSTCNEDKSVPKTEIEDEKQK